MNKQLSIKLILFVVLIAIGIFGVLGLNEFASRSFQEELPSEIATNQEEDTTDLNEESIHKHSVEEVEKEKAIETIIVNDQKTIEGSKEKITPKLENKPAETKSVEVSIKQEPAPSEQSKQQKEQQKETKQDFVDKQEKVIEKEATAQVGTGEAPPQEAKKNTVLITIIGPKDIGTILPTTQVEINESDTVLDALQQATRANKIQMEFRGTSASAYVEGIQNIYEFDLGPESGWMYSVNGEFPTKSAGSLEVKPNDQIKWLYTENLGKDIGANR